MLSPEVIDALYQALLGREPDADGAAHWAQASNVDEVIAGFSSSDEFAGRLRELTALLPAARRNVADGASALLVTEGLVALNPEQLGPAALRLRSLPWQLLLLEAGGASTGRQSALLAIGPYAAELAAQASDRHGVAATAGLHAPSAQTPPPRHDVLVLTEPGLLELLLSLRRDVISGTRERLLTPAPGPASAAALPAALRAARLQLHQAGFNEVVQIEGKRFGTAPVVHGVSHATPDPAELLQLTSDELEPSAGWWLLASRTPVHAA